MGKGLAGLNRIRHNCRIENFSRLPLGRQPNGKEIVRCPCCGLNAWYRNKMKSWQGRMRHFYVHRRERISRKMPSMRYLADPLRQELCIFEE